MRGQRFGGEVGVAAVRGQGTWSSAVRRPSSDAHSRWAPTRGDRARASAPSSRRGCVGGPSAARRPGDARQGFLQSVGQGVDHVVPPVALVGDELLQDGHRGRRCARRVAPVLHAPAAAGGVGETGPLAQEAADLDPGVHALLEPPDELHDGLVARRTELLDCSAESGTGVRSAARIRRTRRRRGRREPDELAAPARGGCAAAPGASSHGTARTPARTPRRSRTPSRPRPAGRPPRRRRATSSARRPRRRRRRRAAAVALRGAVVELDLDDQERRHGRRPAAPGRLGGMGTACRRLWPR